MHKDETADNDVYAGMHRNETDGYGGWRDCAGIGYSWPQIKHGGKDLALRLERLENTVYDEHNQ